MPIDDVFSMYQLHIVRFSGDRESQKNICCWYVFGLFCFVLFWVLFFFCWQIKGLSGAIFSFFSWGGQEATFSVIRVREFDHFLQHDAPFPGIVHVLGKNRGPRIFCYCCPHGLYSSQVMIQYHVSDCMRLYVTEIPVLRCFLLIKDIMVVPRVVHIAELLIWYNLLLDALQLRFLSKKEVRS